MAAPPVASPAPATAAPSWDRRECVRVVCISDTHGLHEQLRLPPGDVLVHAGDITNCGGVEQLRDFFLFLQRAVSEGGFKRVVVIPGNHDVTLDGDFCRSGGQLRFLHADPAHVDFAAQAESELAVAQAAMGDTLIFLRHAAAVIHFSDIVPDHSDSDSVQPLVVFGSPWTPFFYGTLLFPLPASRDSRSHALAFPQIGRSTRQEALH